MKNPDQPLIHGHSYPRDPGSNSGWHAVLNVRTFLLNRTVIPVAMGVDEASTKQTNAVGKLCDTMKMAALYVTLTVQRVSVKQLTYKRTPKEKQADDDILEEAKDLTEWLLTDALYTSFYVVDKDSKLYKINASGEKERLYIPLSTLTKTTVQLPKPATRENLLRAMCSARDALTQTARQQQIEEQPSAYGL